jgi:hypothetical protein
MRGERRPKMSENKVLRGVLGPKRDKVTGYWKKCHCENLHGSKKSQYIIRVLKIKNNGMGGAYGMHGERRSACRFWRGGNPRERDHLGFLGVDESY